MCFGKQIHELQMHYREMEVLTLATLLVSLPHPLSLLLLFIVILLVS